MLGILSACAGATSSTEKTDPLELRRLQYQDARNALRAGQISQFRSLRQQLDDYPLVVYLDYYELNRRLSRAPVSDIDDFLQTYDESHLAEKLRHRWLLSLASQQNWQQFLHYFPKDDDSARLQCLALEARFRLGDNEALSQATELWNVKHSQPKQCDRLFHLWTDAGYLTEEIAWQRFTKAINAGNRTLANYLVRFLSGERERLAKLYVEVGRYPHRITRTSRFQEQTAEMQNLISYGIKRYATRNPQSALQAWVRYDAQHLFGDDLRREVKQHLALRLLRRGHSEAVSTLLSDISDISSTSLQENILVDAIRNQDWAQVHQHILQLPESLQQTSRWMYWRARALEQPDIKDTNYRRADELYTHLSLKRDFYAFLASDKLGHDYYLGDTPIHIDAETLSTVQQNPSLRRAHELFHIGDTLNANREWYFMSQRLGSDKEHIAAAKLAHQWGWHNKTITSLASARSWDDLQMRFPLAYSEHMLSAARHHSISPHLLFAIARQESAFAEQARSPAGALGLMQLMPGTAKQTASRAGVPLQKTMELLSPDKNIRLGSAYITELLEKYQGNRILAAAAYNAGPHRVDQWLQSSAQKLPFDVWIEVIPFRETRRYVQNVLAYSVIYGYRSGDQQSLLSKEESFQPL